MIYKPEKTVNTTAEIPEAAGALTSVPKHTKTYIFHDLSFSKQVHS